MNDGMMALGSRTDDDDTIDGGVVFVFVFVVVVVVVVADKDISNVPRFVAV